MSPAPLNADIANFSAQIDRLTPRARNIDLLAASVLGLFLEVALIRWHGTEFRACAYFKNITLLACFLGLGLGFARSRRSAMSFPFMLPLLAAQVLLMDILSLGQIDQYIRNPIPWEILWGIGVMTGILQYALFYGFFAALFITTILIFIPIGQLTGRLMREDTPLSSYTINIAGSILGVLAFGLLSYFWLPPANWFAVAAMLALWLGRHSRRGLLSGGCAAAMMLGWIGHEPRAGVRNIYSPYQRLELQPERLDMPDGRFVPAGVHVSANKTYYMHGLNLSSEFVQKYGQYSAMIREKADWYDMPLKFKSAPASVLIIGSGAGNDVAAALRGHAEHIDAVEIDPAIRWVGETYHPESPYQAANVRSIVNDARAFMKRSPPSQYDLIIFGLIDSHTLLSGMSSIRLDNFVYTLESFADARKLLRPGGMICLSFAVGPDGPFSARIFEMLKNVFGHAPRAYSYGDHDTMFVIGLSPTDVPTSLPSDESNATVRESTETVAAAAQRIHPCPSEDDWPFPFLTGRSLDDFPRPYLYLVIMLAGISILWILSSRERGAGLDGQFFFLGGAFLLIETKGITELALVMGTTWIVTSVVIVGILLMILLANWTVHLLNPRRIHVVYLLLLASLAIGFAIPIHLLLGQGLVVAALGSAILLLMPLYFAGIIFATSLRKTTNLPSAFASNLLGAILGGLCEYMSMITGFRSLYLVGMALYGLSWLFLALSRAPTRQPVA
jgi:spermidine synthase